MHPGSGIPRRTAYAVLTLVLVGIAGYAAFQAVRLQDKLEQESSDRGMQELEALRDGWELLVHERISALLMDLESAAAGDWGGPGTTDARRRTLAASERRHRTGASSFEAWYLWEETTGGPTFHYPPPILVEDIDALAQSSGCMRAATQLLATTTTTTNKVRALVRCHRWPDAQGLLAVSLAGELLLDENRPEDALDILDAIELKWNLPLSEVGAMGLPPRMVLNWQLLGARALGDIGDTRRKALFLARAGREITELEGDALDLLLPYLDYPILADLSAIGARQDINWLRDRKKDALRRQAGYHQTRSISQRGETPLDTSVEEPRILVSENGPDPYLLVWASMPSEYNSRIGAIQLVQDRMLSQLIASARPGIRDRLVVLDAHGEPVQGALSGDDVWIEVPLTVLPNLRLGLRGLSPNLRANRLDRLAVNLVPVAVALLLGSLALLATLTADRRQRELYLRQQAFIARVTHELKTPLAGIRVMAESMEFIDDEDQRAEFADRIVGEVERLSERVDEVLQVARERRILAPEPYELHELVREVVKTWAPRFEREGASLDYDLQRCPPSIGDRAMLRDLVSNLLSNALKYRHENRPGVCRISCRTEGEIMVIDVVDNGIGIPDDMREHVFQAFARVEGPGRGKAGGHGLGLAFVADAVKKHRGTIECRDGLDGGARFTVRMKRRT